MFARGLVDEADFRRRNAGAAQPRRCSRSCCLGSRPKRTWCFTHGDYCLPNVMIDGEEVAGFVDWGWAGVADRYKDIALVVRSLEYNTGKDLRTMFFDAYGAFES